MQQLLRLPPPLRSQLLAHSCLSRSLEGHSSQARLTLKRTYAQVKPPPKPRRRDTTSFTQETSPPTPTYTKRSSPSTGNPYADRLCHDADQVLLYNSPSHTSYTLTSYFFGALFFLGAINTALVTRDPPQQSDPDTPKRPPLPMYIRLAFGIGAISFAAMGTVFVLAPTKIIRRVWLLKRPPPPSPAFGQSPYASYAFQIETKLPLPFRRGRGRTIIAPTPNVSIDREIRAQEIYWRSVPLTSSSPFSAHYLPTSHPDHLRPATSPSTFRARLGAANASLINAWPTFKANIKRMFLREGIAYVHVIGEHGQWKLDLQGAEVLDRGLPLEGLMGTDVRMARGVVPFLQGLFAGGRGRGM